MLRRGTHGVKGVECSAQGLGTSEAAQKVSLLPLVAFAAPSWGAEDFCRMAGEGEKVMGEGGGR